MSFTSNIHLYFHSNSAERTKHPLSICSLRQITPTRKTTFKIIQTTHRNIKNMRNRTDRTSFNDPGHISGERVEAFDYHKPGSENPRDARETFPNRP